MNQPPPASSPEHAEPNAVDPTAAPAHAQVTRAVAVGCLLAMIALGLAWELWLAPLRPGGSWLVLKVLPLCIPLAGLLKHRMYTYRWMSLVVWIYFTEGVVRATSDRQPSATLALIQTVLCVVLFVALAAHVRLRLADAKKRQTTDAASLAA